MAQLAKNPLCRTERDRLAELEATIQVGIKVAVETWLAVLEVRDRRLYREQYRTFEEYMRERWGLARTHSYRLCQAGEVVNNLVDRMSPRGDTPLPETEKQARALSALDDPDDQAAVWRRAVEEQGGRPTAADVERVSREWEAGVPPEVRRRMIEEDEAAVRGRGRERRARDDYGESCARLVRVRELYRRAGNLIARGLPGDRRRYAELQKGHAAQALRAEMLDKGSGEG